MHCFCGHDHDDLDAVTVGELLWHLVHQTDRLERTLAAILDTQEIIMSEQADIDAAAAQIQSDVAAENAATAAIKTEIADLEAKIAAGQPADLTGLKAAVAALDSAAADEQSAAPAPAPAPAAAPSPDVAPPAS